MLQIHKTKSNEDLGLIRYKLHMIKDLKDFLSTQVKVLKYYFVKF